MSHISLLFDLDGTISDPLEGIARSFNYALSFYGYEEMPVSELAQYIGSPLNESFKGITGINDDFEINAFITKYRERYSCVVVRFGVGLVRFGDILYSPVRSRSGKR